MDTTLIIVAALVIVVAVVAIATVAIKLAGSVKQSHADTTDVLADLLSDAMSQNLVMQSNGDKELERLKIKGRGERVLMETRPYPSGDRDTNELDPDGALSGTEGPSPLIEQPIRRSAA